jgi:hypothetical protein
MGGAQTAIGAAATVFGAPEIGIPLMTGGVGQLAGTGAGGSKGGQIGEMAGLAAGGLGEGGFGLAGMGPMASTLSSAPALQSVAQSPTVGAIPPMNVGGMQLPGLSAGSQPLLGQSAGALQQSLYPTATSMNAIPNLPPNAYAPSLGGSSGQDSGIMSFLKSQGGSQLASSALQGLTGGGQQPPQGAPQPPQLRPQSPPVVTPPITPAVAKVPGSQGAPAAGGAGQNPMQMLALLRMLGGTGGVG